ncbi:hypothetical protein Tco_0245985 [Tanacetum coccineum]
MTTKKVSDLDNESELGAVESKLSASMAKMMKMLSAIKLSNERRSPKVCYSEAYMEVNEGAKRSPLKFDDLGFPIPPFKENPEGSNHGGKGLENENRFEEYTPFEEPGMLHHGNISNHHWSDYRRRKLKMPLFDGKDSHEWIYKVESKITVLFMGRVTDKVVGEILTVTRGTLYEQFLAITQEGFTYEYVSLFETLAGQLAGISKQVMEDTFIKGLRPELRSAVRVMQPEGLNHAMKLPMIIDENKAQSSSQVAIPSGGQTMIKGEHFRRMTESELKERRDKGLCFRCEEKFKPGHRCAPHTMQVMIVDDNDAKNEPYLQVKPYDHALKAD